MEKHKIIIANWKMNMNFDEIHIFAEELNKFIKKNKDIVNNKRIIIAPSYIGIIPAKSFFKNPIEIIAQDVHYAKNGPYTGSVSYSQIYQFDVYGSIVGHSEARQYLNQSDEIINKKVNALIDNKMFAVICIGESATEYKNKKTLTVLKNQLSKALKNISIVDLDRIILAYEPLWAIGTNVIPTAKEIFKTTSAIRKIIGDIYHDTKINDKINILYGGSVNDNNIRELNKISSIDGFLIGNASLNVAKFIEIIKNLD